MNSGMNSTTEVNPAVAPRRSMLPHEHGAWGQLAMPLLTALAIGRPTAASVALAASVVLAFVAHEPALVLLGQRGRRARDEDGARARRWLAVTGGLAGAAAVAGLTLSPLAARLAFAVPAALAALVVWLVLRRLEKTGAGDIFAACFFTRLYMTRDPWEAARFATQLSAISVTRPGLTGIPTQDEIEACMVEVY